MVFKEENRAEMQREADTTNERQRQRWNIAENRSRPRDGTEIKRTERQTGRERACVSERETSFRMAVISLLPQNRNLCGLLTRCHPIS